MSVSRSGGAGSPFHTRGRFQERMARAVASGRIFPYLALSTSALVLVTGFVVRLIAPGDFGSFGEGVWWAVVTLATVGYGDVVPTSPWGRFVGSIVIVCGVTFLAFLTATVTSLFVASVQREAAAEETELRAASDEETRALLRRVLERLEAVETAVQRKGD
jgi:voltage-gated potassium channel